MHLCNSYYRYKGKFYLIISDRQQIHYSYEKNSVGEPVRVNNVYTKIRNGDLMLSPFAVWEVKLTEATDKHSFQELEVYKDKVDLELAGRGTYVAGDVEELSFTEDEYKGIGLQNYANRLNEF
ncbi:hypothetical protein CDAR_526661 [Caerostris darwini]|uniref:Uncharacterized protein n=1 Tax=Caerostris darwini TaxID=1538125 RepID=A0AAV4Q305_9ARAC|nr:hypothetical protein CDAR_526661 [Caerostris darwini]